MFHFRLAILPILLFALVGCATNPVVQMTTDRVVAEVVSAGGYDQWKSLLLSGRDYAPLSLTSSSLASSIGSEEEFLAALNSVCPHLFLASEFLMAEKCFTDAAQMLVPRLATNEAVHGTTALARTSDLHFMQALLYFELADYEKSIEHADLGMRYFSPGLSMRQLGLLGHWGMFDSIGYGHSLAAASRSASRLGNSALADEYLNTCKTIDVPSGDHMLMRNAACARVEIERKNYAEARRLLAAAEATKKFQLDAEATFGAQVDLSFVKGILCENDGDLPCAKRHFERLLRGTDVGSGHPYTGFQLVQYRTDIYFDLLNRLANINIKLGNAVDAEKNLWEAITAIESARAKVRTENSRMGFAGGKERPYRDLINLYISQGRHHEAFALVERSKARALIDVLVSKKTLGTGSRAEASEVLLAANHADTAVVKTGPSGHRSVDRGLTARVKSLSNDEPELSALISATPPKITELQKWLAVDETLIEYFGAGDVLFVFVLTQKGPVRSFSLSSKDLSANVRAMRAAIADPSTGSYRGLAQVLYDQLLLPLGDAIKTEKLTVVAHGELHYLPFAALHDGRQFIAQRYTLRLLPSASVLPFLEKSRPQAAYPLLTLGNPDLKDPRLDLPAAQEEAILIAKKHGGHLALRKDATETLIKTQGRNYRRLHFASHGTFDPERPLSSALMLSADNENDGMLTVSELYNLELSAELVTLSACDTALGKISGGDDIVGFTRGLLFAGAETIVSSLWKIDDAATSKLMQIFYQNLSFQAADEALRSAQVATMRTNPHPYYWAAFQVTGAR